VYVSHENLQNTNSLTSAGTKTFDQNLILLLIQDPQINHLLNTIKFKIQRSKINTAEWDKTWLKRVSAAESSKA